MDVRWVIGIAVLVAVVIFAAIALALVMGMLGVPTAGIEDIGDWGEITEKRTEVITTAWVDNPNPIGLTLGESVALTYRLSLNDVELADGTTREIGLQPGNNTVDASTFIRNEQLSTWWVAFVQNDETIDVRAEPTVQVSGLVSTSIELPSYETTLLADSTPIITSLTETVSRLEGRYVLTDPARDQFDSLVDTGLVDGDVFDEMVPGSRANYSVGYEIERGWATWGEVTEKTTTLRVHFRLHNPSKTLPVPAEPEHLGLSIAMNDVELFSVRSDDVPLENPADFTLREPLDRRVLLPGETTEAVYTVEMDNDRVGEWFRSHVQHGERTEVRTELQLVFGVGNLTVDVPPENPVAYSCDFQTGIFVDDQKTETTCGKRASRKATR